MRKLKKRPPRDATYDVGYAKPPDHGKFKKGQSGNRKGRHRRQLRSIVEIVQDALDEEIYVEALGKKLSCFDIAMRRVARDAAKGEPGSLRMLLQIMQFSVKYRSLSARVSMGDLERMIEEIEYDLEKKEDKSD